MKSALRLCGVQRQFSTQYCVGPLSVTVPHGTFLTVLGPSGCGKTTVLRMIAGLEVPDSGSIHLFGQDITRTLPEKRPINTIFQQCALFPHMTVWENVAFGLRMQGCRTDEIVPRVQEALNRVQLDQFDHRYPASLSGGQQQRVAIARAVVNRPKVLLLDESLSALDYRLRRRMQNELKALQRRLGITFVFVTHDQEEALSIADRILVMREGQIEQDGAPRAIYETPCNLFVANFIGESNLLNAKVTSIISEQTVQVLIENRLFVIHLAGYLKRYSIQDIRQLMGQTLKVLLRPEDMRIQELNGQTRAIGMVGHVRERNYRGMTLDSLIELESGKWVMASEFFNEDDPDVDHSLHQKVAVTWVPNWEVVLPDEASS